MPRRFSAHLGFLFTEVPFEERFAAARDAGFDVVEHPAPFALPASQVRKRLAENGLSMAQIGSGLGGEGRKGLASLPGQEAAFRDDLLRALDYAEETGCPLLHPMAGLAESGTDEARHEELWLENIAFAMEMARERPVSIFVEAISRASAPGYFLHRLDQYLALAGQLDAAPLVLVDSYHAALNYEDAANFVRANAPRIAHIHIADTHGRHEPGTGDYDFETLEAALSEVKYGGAVGCEYIPQGATVLGLAWRETWPHCG